MEKVEMVEKLRSKTNISYEEAKDALENTNWDILDAIVYLERIGKIKKPSVSTYFTNEYKEVPKENLNQITESKEKKKEKFSESFFETICRIIDKGNTILFVIKKNNKVILKLPITVIVLLILFTFSTIILLLIVGLFFEMEFSLEGYNMENSEINKYLKSISKYIIKIKNDFKRDKGNG